MKKTLLLVLLLSPFTPLSASENAAQLFKTLCASCHAIEGPPTVAPPIFGVKNHVLGAYPQREAFVQRIVDWVAKPDASKALMPGAVRRFGLMPMLPYPPEQVRAIAEFLYDTNLRMPDWYEQHYRQEHGEAPPK